MPAPTTCSPAGPPRFDPGSVARDITIPLIDDHRHERTEHFDVQLSDAHGAHISDRYARIWIGDDDSGR